MIQQILEVAQMPINNDDNNVQWYHILKYTNLPSKYNIRYFTRQSP